MPSYCVVGPPCAAMSNLPDGRAVLAELEGNPAAPQLLALRESLELAAKAVHVEVARARLEHHGKGRAHLDEGFTESCRRGGNGAACRRLDVASAFAA